MVDMSALAEAAEKARAELRELLDNPPNMPPTPREVAGILLRLLDAIPAPHNPWE